MTESRTVQYNLLSTEGIVLWLDRSNLITLAVGGAIAVIATQIGGPLGLLTVGPLVAALAYVGLRKKFGVPMPVLIWREIMFRSRQRMGATQQIVRPEKRAHSGELGRINLPGQSGYLQLWETSEDVLVVFDPQLQTASISCLLYGGEFLEASASSRDSRIEAWARVKGGWTQKRGIERVSVLERTSPGSVEAARAYYRANVVPGNEVLRQSYEQSLAITESRVVRHRTQVTLTFDVSVLRDEIKANGGGKAGLLSYLELEIEGSGAALSGCGFVGIEWMNARTWAGTGRAMLDPEYAAVLEIRDGSDVAGVDPLAVGPMSFEEKRTYVVADSGFHRTFWIHEWPRMEAYPGFTKDVVFARMPDKSPIRHILNIVEAPVTQAVALKRISDAKKTWKQNDNVRRKLGRDQSATDKAEWDALIDQEHELVAGRGEYRFSAYLTVTALSLIELDRASSAMRSALAGAGLEPQLLYAQQAEALMMNAYPTGKGMK